MRWPTSCLLGLSVSLSACGTESYSLGSDFESDAGRLDQVDGGQFYELGQFCPSDGGVDAGIHALTGEQVLACSQNPLHEFCPLFIWANCKGALIGVHFDPTPYQGLP